MVSGSQKKKISVTGDLIRAKAEHFRDKFIISLTDKRIKEELQSFVASQGWPMRFRKRFGIKAVTLCGESMSVSIEDKNKCREEIMNVIREYHPDDVYNADETSLYFRMMPSKTLVEASESYHGIKRDKERVTILAMINSIGTYKNRLIMIGKSKTPRCLKNINKQYLPLEYTSACKAWMNSSIFKEFLINFNKEMQRKSKNVLLQLDNCTAHKASTKI